MVFIKISGYLLQTYLVFIKISGYLLQTYLVFIKISGYLLQTYLVFIKISGYLLQTYMVFIKISGYLLQTYMVFIKISGYLLQTYLVFIKLTAFKFLLPFILEGDNDETHKDVDHEKGDDDNVKHKVQRHVRPVVLRWAFVRLRRIHGVLQDSVIKRKRKICSH